MSSRSTPRWQPFALAALLFAGVGAAWGARERWLRSHVPVASAAPLSEDPVAAARARLLAFEESRRRATDFAHLPPADRNHGADPYALLRLDDEHTLGVLRAASALVVLDGELNELQRVSVPSSVVSAARDASGDVWVAGERAPTLTRFRFVAGQLRPRDSLRIPGIFGLRALETGAPGVLYALDVHDGRLLTMRPGAKGVEVAARPGGHGALSLKRVGRFLIVNALLDHRLTIYGLNAQGDIGAEVAHIRHDGPIWGFAAVPFGDGLLIAETGVEDHPLDRSDGAFGYVDSFAFADTVSASGVVTSLWRTNVAEFGVVTPKAPLLTIEHDAATLFVSGYGSEAALRLQFDAGKAEPPRVTRESLLPGTSAVLALASGALAFADPLLDAWVLRAPPGSSAGLRVVPVEATAAPRAGVEERLGEALFFTGLMAPFNSSEGAQSRFTCETCHFEGYVDGRVHYTGREDVHAATKPLRGLFNNRPHFSRALDADLSTVSHHEFRVAGKASGKDPWFTLKTADFPWLAQLGSEPATLEPEALRRALMVFLMGFTHTQNPAVVGRHEFTDAERRGAALFADHCQACHAPRLVSDEATSAVPLSNWERFIFSEEGPIVWASAEYRKTGVTPYVHELGARTPSLRRLYAKWPYFTNGSALSVVQVLQRARFDEARFFHAEAEPNGPMKTFTESEVTDLAAFLDLL